MPDVIGVGAPGDLHLGEDVALDDAANHFGGAFDFGLPGLVLVLAAALAALTISAAASRMLDGVTGDTYGAAIEIAQVTVMLAVVAAGQRGWLEPTFLR